MANALPILLLGGAAAFYMMAGKKKKKAPEIEPEPEPEPAVSDPDEAVVGFQRILRKSEPLVVLTRVESTDDWVIASADPPAENGPYVGIRLPVGEQYQTRWGMSVADVKNKLGG